mmetsp:Transcript_29355/g.113713  ORF Transcript_29355/g.113713 Transcript_29355/m.113713 type:complete len:160 (+) Transcript_29355:466-945(+)
MLVPGAQSSEQALCVHLQKSQTEKHLFYVTEEDDFPSRSRVSFLSRESFFSNSAKAFREACKDASLSTLSSCRRTQSLPQLFPQQTGLNALFSPSLELELILNNLPFCNLANLELILSRFNPRPSTACTPNTLVAVLRKVRTEQNLKTPTLPPTMNKNH